MKAATIILLISIVGISATSCYLGSPNFVSATVIEDIIYQGDTKRQYSRIEMPDNANFTAEELVEEWADKKWDDNQDLNAINITVHRIK